MDRHQTYAAEQTALREAVRVGLWGMMYRLYDTITG
jgi:hypothetical protein